MQRVFHVVDDDTLSCLGDVKIRHRELKAINFEANASRPGSTQAAEAFSPRSGGAERQVKQQEMGKQSD